MPTISRFYGILVGMYYDDHDPPHFHARYAGHRISLSIPGLAALSGSLPRRALTLVREWARAHEAELLENWTRARKGLPLRSIEPLR